MTSPVPILPLPSGVFALFCKRYFFANELDVRIAKDVLGHASLQTTDRYYTAFIDEPLREAKFQYRRSWFRTRESGSYSSLSPRPPPLFVTGAGTRPTQSNWNRALKRACESVGVKPLPPTDHAERVRAI